MTDPAIRNAARELIQLAVRTYSDNPETLVKLFEGPPYYEEA